MTRNKYILVLLLVALSLPVSSVLHAQTNCQYLVWQDEFDAAGAPADSKWSYDTGGGGWGNNELQTYTSTRTNSWVENGKLIIKAVKSNNAWTSARMVTRQKGDWLNGRIEVKAKLPLGLGTWPAIWMLPTDWTYGDWPKSGEIDIMEHVGYDPGVIHGTAHTEAYNHTLGTQKGGSFTQADSQTTFHVYAIEWDQTEIRWYVDNNLYFTFKNENKTYKEWPFDQRFHLILNIAIGGNWGGAQGIDPNLTSATMEVEYVRVYQNEMPKPVVSGPALNKMGDVVTYQTAAVTGASYTWHFPAGVEIQSGAGTNAVSVKWNDAPGSVSVDVQSACETKSSDPLAVKYQFVPEGNQYPVSPLLNGTLNWKASPGTGNTINLSELSGTVTSAYQITTPTQNPYIYYRLNGIGDFTAHNQLDFDLQIDPANPPSNMRIDLVDVNGNVNLSDLFKISSFATDADFHTFSHVFAAKTDGTFLLDQIVEIRVYFNYGVLGQTGSSSFSLKNVRLQNGQATATNDIHSDMNFKLYPNPARELVWVESPSIEIETVELFNLSGTKLQNFIPRDRQRAQVILEALPAGVYLILINHEYSQKVIVY